MEQEKKRDKVKAIKKKSFNSEDFNKKAIYFTEKYKTERLALEQCLESKVNADINFICARQKEAYLTGISTVFCKKEHDITAKCQKKNEEKWASSCFDETNEFSNCLDQVLRKLYIFNMEFSRQNPVSGVEMDAQDAVKLAHPREFEEKGWLGKIWGGN